jgi:hypothetical protein
MVSGTDRDVVGDLAHDLGDRLRRLRPHSAQQHLLRAGGQRIPEPRLVLLHRFPGDVLHHPQQRGLYLLGELLRVQAGEDRPGCW